MSAINNLKAAWTARLATISDAVVKAEATYLLDNYIVAYEKQAALEAQTIASYSLGGRSVTRRNAEIGRDMIQSMKTELHRYCYGSTTLIDMNINDTEYDIT